MRRRNFIALLGSAAVAWPLAARAQQPDRVRRIGVLMHVTEKDPDGQARLAAFVNRLKDLGWAEGRNLRLDILPVCLLSARSGHDATANGVRARLTHLCHLTINLAVMHNAVLS
jgi:hypothetical protein